MPRAGLRKKIRSFFDVPRWMGFSVMGRTFKSSYASAKALFKVKKSTFSETYEEAVVRMKLTEEALEERKKGFFKMACFYFSLGVVMIAYDAYLFYHHHWVAAVMCLPIVMVLLAFAFKEHFWYTQMRVKRLGLTLSDWLLLLVGEKK